MEQQKFDNNRYNDKNIKFLEVDNHYELWFMDTFLGPDSTNTPTKSELVDVLYDLTRADKTKELHVHIYSYGGELNALVSILPKIMQFDMSVGICEGVCMSAGILLFAVCKEKFADPSASIMFHLPFILVGGKLTEANNVIRHNVAVWNTIIERIQMPLTKEERELSKTSEVYLTGQDLIDRDWVANITNFNKRVIFNPQKLTMIPHPNSKDVYIRNNKKNCYHLAKIDYDVDYTVEEILFKTNENKQPEEQNNNGKSKSDNINNGRTVETSSSGTKRSSKRIRKN